VAYTLIPQVFVLDFDGVITTLDIDWNKLREGVSSVIGANIRSFGEFFAENYPSAVFEKVSDLVKKEELAAARESQLFSDVRPALETIRLNSSKAYVASMQSIDVVKYFLEKNAVQSYFARVLGRESGGSKRGQLEQIIEMERQGGVIGRTNLLLIDDSRRNIKVGKDLGFTSILFKRSDSFLTLNDLIKSLITEAR
jgi:phosphoglycolate phosphatase-like HAD superfamily hydrolase